MAAFGLSLVFGLRDENGNHIIRVLVEVNLRHEDGRCGKQQGMNEIVISGVWSSCTGEILQQLSFGNPVSSSDTIFFISKDSFLCDGFFIIQYVGLFATMTML